MIWDTRAEEAALTFLLSILIISEPHPLIDS